ncbi:lysophospholipase [Phakopsora pachyrhizi]|uniref:Lysophospholipase n=1 Tax=Phakopsora pachyrhizi TaxID=170000 RepID=A0AAV0BNL4_PHAPC|nr:lysophospholipase [Phakopsora pachyrhizi]CAH7687776.1 lysophospholipase [Phakopsora pachyrhizi]
MLLRILFVCLVFCCFKSRTKETPNSYAPSFGPCPSGPLVRYAGTVAAGDQKIGSKEADYIRRRRAEVLPGAYKAYLSNVQSSLRRKHEKLPPYVARILSGSSENLPRVSAAISGGGLRAVLFGAGVLNALDGRNASSAKTGTGGLLQALDYISGLSGGSGLVLAMAQANFPTIYEAAFGSKRRQVLNKKTDLKHGVTNGWLTHLSYALAGVPGQTGQGLSSAEKALQMAVSSQVLEKAHRGFDITISDTYGRMLAYHFSNGTTEENFFRKHFAHGMGETLSGLIHNVPTIQTASQPFPIVTSLAQSPRQDYSKLLSPAAAIPLTNNHYEFNIFETGSWDPNLSSFIKTSSLGTTLYKGKPANPASCVSNFDNLGFIMATSACIFSKFQAITSLFVPSSSGTSLPLSSMNTSRIPNPFHGLGTDGYLDRDTKTLSLLDSALSGENIPFAPLLVPARKVDVIIAVDAVGAKGEWSDGSSLFATAVHSSLMPSKSYPFPRIYGSPASFNPSHPVFLGCEEPVGVPLVVFIPNSPPMDGTAPTTNIPVLSLQVPTGNAMAMLDGATKLAKRGKSQDSLWSACLACAVVDRRRARLNVKRTGICASCFDRYCNKPSAK